VIRLDENEKVVASLKKVCQEERAASGVILSTVGALKKGTLIFRPGCRKNFNEHLEIIGNGNISRAGGRVKIHLHIAGGNENSAKAGHLVEGVVTAFCEIVVQVLSGFAMKRRLNKDLLEQKVLNPYKLEP